MKHGDQDPDRAVGGRRPAVVVLETGGPVLTPWRDRAAAMPRPGIQARRAGTRSRGCCSATLIRAGGSRRRSLSARPTCPRPAIPRSTPGSGRTFTTRRACSSVTASTTRRPKTPAYPFGFGALVHPLQAREAEAAPPRRPKVSVALTVPAMRRARTGIAVPQVYVAMPGAAGEAAAAAEGVHQGASGEGLFGARALHAGPARIRALGRRLEGVPRVLRRARRLLLARAAVASARRARGRALPEVVDSAILTGFGRQI